MEGARPHGGECAVDDVQEALAIVEHRVDQLQVAHGEAVEAHIMVFLNARQARDMSGLRVLGLFEVAHYCARRHNGCFEMVDPETFEVLYLKMVRKLFFGCFFCKRPIVELEDIVFSAEEFLYALFLSAHHEHLLR